MFWLQLNGGPKQLLKLQKMICNQLFQMEHQAFRENTSKYTIDHLTQMQKKFLVGVVKWYEVSQNDW